MTEPEKLIFPDQNSTNFPISVKNNLLAVAKKEYSKTDFLKYHQFIIYQYMIKNHKTRGLLLFHEMGMGKSITATALAEFYRHHDPERKIIILLSKSLQANFQKNIEKFIRENMKTASKEEGSGLTDTEIDKVVDKKYKFVSLNASNMYTQMTRVDKTKGELEVEKQLKEFTDVVEKDDFLENSLLIVDEFHNLSNSITNGSYNAIRLYDTIMKTKNVKLLFLSGTPVVNNPFELVPTFNMLKGLISLDPKVRMPLFPELKKDFDAFFVDNKKNKIKNAEKFKNRIFGLVSYYGNMYFGSKTKEDFPEEYVIKIERVPMSSEQYARYDMARDFEREEALQKGRVGKAERFSSKGSASSSYRVQSRQISNYLIPEYALGPARGKKARQKFVDKITNKDLENTAIFSPKFAKIIENINKHKNQLGLVYSEFVSGEGLAIFIRLLNLKGYSCWNTKVKLEEDADAFDLPKFSKSPKTKGGAPVKKYAIITGDVSFEERAKIVKIFNGTDNIHGEKITLLLISKTGAEGLDLKNIRHLHLTEPYWNYARLSQIIARAVRYKSHEALPTKERNVQPYIYLSDYPKDFDPKKKKELTTDVQLYTDSVKNKKLIMEFYIALAEASIDCGVHSSSFSKDVAKKIKCKMCSPNNKLLYNPILSKQLLLPDPCDELKTTEIKAKQIDVDGKKYIYSQTSDGDYHIYKYDKNVSGYTLMDSSEPVFSDIMKKLLKMTD